MTSTFGATHAPAYDAIYQSKDYDGEVRLLRRVFSEYASIPIHRILDLGCGTGAHAVRLAANGFHVVGVDRSPEMLAVARTTAGQRDLAIGFLEQDLRHVELTQTFDAAIMMFAVLGYQTQTEDVLDALRSARRHLHPNGLLVFDVWFGPAVLAQRPTPRVREVTQAGEVWVRYASGELDVGRNLCQVDIRLVHHSHGLPATESLERHTVRYFFASELELFLAQAGFRLLRLCAFPELDEPPSEQTWNVMAVASAVD